EKETIAAYKPSDINGRKPWATEINMLDNVEGYVREFWELKNEEIKSNIMRECVNIV
ncbi:hypothetical protein L9F63_014911, partial [Diploptera punctata]